MNLPSFVISILGSPEFTALLLTTFAGIITTVIGVVGYQFRKRILHELSATDYALLRSLAVTAVQYAEQKFAESNGPAKLAAAMEAFNTLIASYGINVTAQQLQKIIEAAVYAETVKIVLPEPVAPVLE